jgi:hypothetical protein
MPGADNTMAAPGCSWPQSAPMSASGGRLTDTYTATQTKRAGTDINTFTLVAHRSEWTGQLCEPVGTLPALPVHTLQSLGICRCVMNLPLLSRTTIHCLSNGRPAGPIACVSNFPLQSVLLLIA